MSELKRYWWCLGLPLLLIGLWLVPSVRPQPGRALVGARAEADTIDPADEVPDAFKRVWAVPVPDFRAASLSPDGDFIGVIAGPAGGRGPTVSLWRQDRTERPLWTRREPDASLIVVGAGGHSVLTGAQMDPTEHRIAFRKGSDGSRIAGRQLDGAIWDARISPDGQYAGIVTGRRSVYVITLTDRPRFHRWSLEGIGNSVAITANSAYLAAGTWDASGVSCYTLTGAAVWQYPADPQARKALANRLFEAQAAAGGRYVLGLSYANVRHSDGELYLWRSDGDGKPLWTYPLQGDTIYPRAAITADGRYIAVSYIRLITRGTHSVSEHLLLMLDQQGRRVFETGGFLFTPTLVALAPDGHRVTVWDGKRTLYNLNRAGRITSTYTMRDSGAIRQIIASPDGRHLLVYTSDGSLSLFTIG